MNSLPLQGSNDGYVSFMLVAARIYKKNYFEYLMGEKIRWEIDADADTVLEWILLRASRK